MRGRAWPCPARSLLPGVVWRRIGATFRLFQTNTCDARVALSGGAEGSSVSLSARWLMGVPPDSSLVTPARRSDVRPQQSRLLPFAVNGRLAGIFWSRRSMAELCSVRVRIWHQELAVLTTRDWRRLDNGSIRDSPRATPQSRAPIETTSTLSFGSRLTCARVSQSFFFGVVRSGRSFRRTRFGVGRACEFRLRLIGTGACPGHQLSPRAVGCSGKWLSCFGSAVQWFRGARWQLRLVDSCAPVSSAGAQMPAFPPNPK